MIHPVLDETHDSEVVISEEEKNGRERAPMTEIVWGTPVPTNQPKLPSTVRRPRITRSERHVTQALLQLAEVGPYTFAQAVTLLRFLAPVEDEVLRVSFLLDVSKENGSFPESYLRQIGKPDDSMEVLQQRATDQVQRFIADSKLMHVALSTNTSRELSVVRWSGLPGTT
jgi:hypothetical protein